MKCLCALEIDQRNLAHTPAGTGVPPKNFNFDREYIQKGSTYQKSEKLFIICNPFHVRRKNLAYFGPQTKKLLTLIYLHPNGLFRETIFRPLGGAAPWNFYTR